MSGQSQAALGGYLLEEALAWLLRTSGYQLLHDPEPEGNADPDLRRGRHGLLVRGRGSDHQADVLGEFVFTPPFSMPVRLFVEAKFRSEKTGLQAVRNAHGVIHDVNEHYTHTSPTGRPRRRFRYAYALFSSSPFTQPAQDYAIAHQISLIDLSGPPYDPLRHLIAETAQYVHGLLGAEATPPTIRGQMRTVFRRVLGTMGPDQADLGQGERRLAGMQRYYVAAQRFHDSLQSYAGGEVLLGFPPAPFVLTLAASPGRAMVDFLEYADLHPNHHVYLRRSRDGALGSNWELTPLHDHERYALSFGVPQRIEEWISASERPHLRAREVKTDLLPAIVIYRMVNGAPRVYRLEYAPEDFRR